MKDYHTSIFFEPWIGTEYKNGITVNQKGEIQLGTKENDFPKIMILGRDHYCEKREKCEEYINRNKEIYPNDTAFCNMQTENAEGKKIFECGQLNYCRKYTKHVMEDAINKVWESASHTNFRTALFGLQSIAQDWNHILFFNFFQRSSPHPKNKTEQTKATEALAQVLANNKPDIIFIWGNKNSQNGIGPAIFANINIFQENFDLADIYKDSSKIPQIQINNLQERPFIILKYKNEDKKCLLCFLQHPSPSNKKFDKLESFLAIRCFLQHYQDLIIAENKREVNIQQGAVNTITTYHYNAKIYTSL